MSGVKKIILAEIAKNNGKGTSYNNKTIKSNGK